MADTERRFPLRRSVRVGLAGLVIAIGAKVGYDHFSQANQPESVSLKKLAQDLPGNNHRRVRIVGYEPQYPDSLAGTNEQVPAVTPVYARPTLNALHVDILKTIDESTNPPISSNGKQLFNKVAITGEVTNGPDAHDPYYAVQVATERVIQYDVATQGKAEKPTVDPKVAKAIRAIDNKYGVTVDTVTAGDWQLPDLKQLQRVLGQLPPQMYQADANGQKVAFEYNGLSRTDGNPRDLLPFEVGGPGYVVLDTLNAPDAQTELATVAGQLALGNMSLKTTKDGEETSPWFPKLNKALGEDWFTASYQLGHLLNHKLYKGSIDTDGKVTITDKSLPPDKKAFYDRVYTAMEVDPHAGFSLSPTFFITNMAGDYTRGKAYFDRMYGSFMSKQQVNGARNFLKDTVFDGKEYGNVSR